MKNAKIFFKQSIDYEKWKDEDENGGLKNVQFDKSKNKVKNESKEMESRI